MSQEGIKNKRSFYNKIDQDKRRQIIDRIINKGEQLKAVSQIVGINVSTCKAIIKVYQQQGRVGKKKTRNKVVQVVQTYSFYILQNSKLNQICPLKIVNSKFSVQQKFAVEEQIENKCKQKAEKFLLEAVQTHKKVQQAMRQTQSNSENKLVLNQTNYMPFGFYQTY